MSAAASEPQRSSIIPPPPPISVPVWSLSTSTRALVSHRSQRQHDDSDKDLSQSSPQMQPLPETSMNIVTFCSAVSVAPPKLWIVSLYHNTLTKDSFLASGHGVLQLLRPMHKTLVPVLGKRTGYETGYSKQHECQALNFGWVPLLDDQDGSASLGDDDNENESRIGTLEVLPACALYVHLRVRSTIPAGDHVVALCEATGTSHWDDLTQRCTLVRDTNNENGKVFGDMTAAVTVAAAAGSLDPSTVLYTGQLREEGIL
jgi:flavin reductase (DIM6/NTAB) family NADH-FMN oxidoreductase RutF